MNHIIVALALNASDENVIKFAKKLSLQYEDLKLTFVNVHKPLELDETLSTRFPEVTETVNNAFIEEMVKVTHGASFYGCEVNYLALEGDVLKQLITLTQESNADMVIVGRSTDKEESLNSQLLVRKLLGNVLIVPNHTEYSFSAIGVAVDFSPSSRLAFEQAIDLAKHFKAKLTLLHTFNVPDTYYKSGKSYTEFAQVMRELTDKEASKFLNEFDLSDLSVEVDISLIDDGSVSKHLVQLVKKHKLDMLVLGSKGRSNLSSVLMGSIAESMLKRDVSVPLFISKNAKENLSFWKALKLM